MGVSVEATNGDLTRFEYKKLLYMPSFDLANQRTYHSVSMQNNPAYAYMLDGTCMYGEEIARSQPTIPSRSNASFSPQSSYNGAPPRVSMPCSSGSSQAFVVRDIVKDDGERTVVSGPPKKKWIKEYLEEEPHSPMAVGILDTLIPVPHCNSDSVSPHTVQSLPLLNHGPPSPDYLLQHSTIINNTNGSQTILNNGGSPNNGSPTNQNIILGLGRAGTREVHNKLEKNRRAHLKECFEILKRQLPASSDDKKTSNLSILGSAIRYIQVLRRKEREYEHEMERLAREKIASQQRLTALQREINSRRTGAVKVPLVLPGQRVPRLSEEQDERLNGQALGPCPPVSISPRGTNGCDSPFMNGKSSPPRTLNLTTKPHHSIQTFSPPLNLHADDSMSAACTLASIASPRRARVQGTLNLSTPAAGGTPSVCGTLNHGAPTTCGTLNFGTNTSCGTLNFGTNTSCGTLNFGTNTSCGTLNFGTNTSCGTLNFGTNTTCGTLNLSTPTTCGTLNLGTARTLNLGTSVPSTAMLSTPGTLNLSIKPNMLTVTTIPASIHQNVKTKENGLTQDSGTSLIHHPTHIQLPLTQVVGSTGLMVSPPVLQLLSTPGALRVIQAQPGHLKTNGGVGAGSLVVSTLAPLVVSQAGHILPTPAPSYNKIVDCSIMKSSMPPITLNGQYVNGALMKTTNAHTYSPHTHSHAPHT